MIRRPPRSTLFPSTPLSRSRDAVPRHAGGVPPARGGIGPPWGQGPALPDRRGGNLHSGRSEEHTSELQSRLHLVCRLLLEKKKNKKNNTQLRTHENRQQHDN